ncbi:MAG: hypothetical protein V3T01_06070 [Myxococcota bacterium]
MALGVALGVGLALGAGSSEPATSFRDDLQYIEDPATVVRSQSAATLLAIQGRHWANAAKAGIAAAGAALLAWGLLLVHQGRPRAFQSLRDGILLWLGLVSVLAWCNFLQFHHPRFVHPADIFHYYMGAKYFQELGYTRLYECVAVTDLELGRVYAEKSPSIRNLETNQLEPVAPVLDDPNRCRAHFSAERWKAFRRDAHGFRSRLPFRVWRNLRTDHGYNGTPAWGILGTTLASVGPATPGLLLALALLDPLLLLATGACILWAFGWRVLCVAAIFWGTNYPAQFGWTGGSFLRQDWLAATIAGICCLKRDRPAMGGFLLATAAALRVFPVLLLAALALQAATRMLRQRRWVLSVSHRRGVLGALLATATLLGLSSITAGGIGAWPAFVANSRVHLDTPLVNHMGLRTALSHDRDARSELSFDGSAEDPFADWKASRHETFAGRRLVYFAAVFAFALLLARATVDQPDWVTAVLGIGLLPVAGEVTGYYYGILLAFAFLWHERPSIGVALCALSALSWLFVETFHWTDEILVATSLAVVGLAVLAPVAILRGEVVRSRPS